MHIRIYIYIYICIYIYTSKHVYVLSLPGAQPAAVQDARARPGAPLALLHPPGTGPTFFFFFITLGLELSDTKVYEP